MSRNKFGSIRKLPSTKYQVRYVHNGQAKTAKTLEGKALTFSTEKEARAYLVQLQSDLLQGVNPYEAAQKRQYTVRERVEMYLQPSSGARLSGTPLRPSTIRLYRHLAENYLYKSFDGFVIADLGLTKITRADVMKWYQLVQERCVEKKVPISTKAHPARTWALANGYITSTHGRISPTLVAKWEEAGAPVVTDFREVGSGISQLAKAYRLLKSVLNVALEDELISINPCRIKGAGQSKSPERPTATPEQIAMLAGEVPERYKAAVLLAAFSSMRSSELFGLQRKHINPLHRSITIEHQLSSYASDASLFAPTKTEASMRTVFVAPELMGVLADHLGRYTGTSSEDLVFTTSNGMPLFKGRKSWFVTAKRRIGLDYLHFHDLRHTGQSLALERGATIKDLQRRAGQSSEIAARGYLHGNKKRDLEVADSLGDVVADAISRIRRIN